MHTHYSNGIKNISIHFSCTCFYLVDTQHHCITSTAVKPVVLFFFCSDSFRRLLQPSPRKRDLKRITNQKKIYMVVTTTMQGREMTRPSNKKKRAQKSIVGSWLQVHERLSGAGKECPFVIPTCALSLWKQNILRKNKRIMIQEKKDLLANTQQYWDICSCVYIITTFYDHKKNFFLDGAFTLIFRRTHHLFQKRKKNLLFSRFSYLVSTKKVSMYVCPHIYFALSGERKQTKV